MKKHVLFIIGIFATTFVVNVNAQSSSKSKVFEETIAVPEIGLHVSFETNLDKNSVLIRVGKSKKFDKGDDVSKLRKFPLYHEEITLQGIQGCYEDNPYGDHICMLHDGKWCMIYCMAEDLKTFPGSQEYVPGKNIYVQYSTPKKTKYGIYDLGNLKGPKKYVPISKVEYGAKILDLLSEESL